jgi:signal transduction histidine kinase
LRNLLENAARHGGGAAEVSVRPTELVVADRGPGVPEAERERIFEPFYRPAGHKEGDGGVGLGLALVRQIAHHHGATVQVEAREGGGSRFILRFGAG